MNQDNTNADPSDQASQAFKNVVFTVGDPTNVIGQLPPSDVTIAVKVGGDDAAQPDQVQALKNAGYQVVVWQSAADDSGVAAVSQYGASGYIAQAEGPDQMQAAQNVSSQVSVPKALVTNVYMGDGQWPPGWTAMPEAYQNSNPHATPQDMINRAQAAGATSVIPIFGTYNASGEQANGTTVSLQTYLSEMQQTNTTNFGVYPYSSLTDQDKQALSAYAQSQPAADNVGPGPTAVPTAPFGAKPAANMTTNKANTEEVNYTAKASSGSSVLGNSSAAHQEASPNTHHSPADVNKATGGSTVSEHGMGQSSEPVHPAYIHPQAKVDENNLVSEHGLGQPIDTHPAHPDAPKPAASVPAGPLPNADTTTMVSDHGQWTASASHETPASHPANPAVNVGFTDTSSSAQAAHSTPISDAPAPVAPKPSWTIVAPSAADSAVSPNQKADLSPHGTTLAARDSVDGTKEILQMSDGTYQAVDKATAQVTGAGAWGDGHGGGIAQNGVGNSTIPASSLPTVAPTTPQDIARAASTPPAIPESPPVIPAPHNSSIPTVAPPGPAFTPPPPHFGDVSAASALSNLDPSSNVRHPGRQID